MSSVVISGDTSGSVTLQAPAVAGTTTLTLPATSGTVITGPGGVVAVTAGGTGLSSATTGDLIVGSGTNTFTKLAIGSNNQVLTSNGTTATWAAAAAGGFSNMQVFTSPGTFTTPASTTKIKVTVVGGGGGGNPGAGPSNSYCGGGGGGGGGAIYVGPVSASTGYAVTVGTGGTDRKSTRLNSSH